MILYYAGAPDNTAVPEAVLGPVPVLVTAFDYVYEKKGKPCKRFRRLEKARKRKEKK